MIIEICSDTRDTIKYTMSDFPNCLVIKGERSGWHFIPGIYLVEVKKFDQLESIKEQLIKPESIEKFKYLVFDTIEDLCPLFPNHASIKDYFKTIEDIGYNIILMSRGRKLDSYLMPEYCLSLSQTLNQLTAKIIYATVFTSKQKQEADSEDCLCWSKAYILEGKREGVNLNNITDEIFNYQSFLKRIKGEK